MDTNHYDYYELDTPNVSDMKESHEYLPEMVAYFGELWMLDRSTSDGVWISPVHGTDRTRPLFVYDDDPALDLAPSMHMLNTAPFKREE